MSRAVEASLLESGGKRKREDNWIDPQNPHDRERQGLCPVGLKNVGQTCWFSAVIQSLFYLPAFRAHVLSYQPSKPMNGIDERHNNKIEFMLELRKLFALMLASQRKYVDPTAAVNILRGNIGNSSATVGINNQQDVSEFTLIVLDWLEQAFKSKAKEGECVQEAALPETTSGDEPMQDECNAENADPNNASSVPPESNQPQAQPDMLAEAPTPDINPMTKMFYGHLQVEGRRQDGEPFAHNEMFGQYPLQVNNFSDIHESIENSTAHETIDAAAAAAPGDKATQERWFTDLPPVLFLSLSRFQFNQQRGLAEKIHNKLVFPESIYMDRYMAENKVVTRAKRDEIRSLKKSRENHKERLQKFTQYGAGDDKMPLSAILQGVLDFASSGVPSNQQLSSNASTTTGDSLMTSPENSNPAANPSQITASSGHLPTALSNLMQVDSPCHSPKMTPASSQTNLDQAGHEDMEVEESPIIGTTLMGPPPAPGAPQVPEESTKNCDRATSGLPSVAPEVQPDVPVPCPKHISEAEFRLIQVLLLA